LKNLSRSNRVIDKGNIKKRLNWNKNLMSIEYSNWWLIHKFQIADDILSHMFHKYLNSRNWRNYSGKINIFLKRYFRNKLVDTDPDMYLIQTKIVKHCNLWMESMELMECLQEHNLLDCYRHISLDNCSNINHFDRPCMKCRISCIFRSQNTVHTGRKLELLANNL